MTLIFAAMNPVINTLWKRRKELGMTQGAVADLLGVSQAAFSMWERGKINTPHDKLEKWCECLGMKLTAVDKGRKR